MVFVVPGKVAAPKEKRKGERTKDTALSAPHTVDNDKNVTATFEEASDEALRAVFEFPC